MILSFTDYHVKSRYIRQLRECRHEHILLEEESMSCVCEDCGAVIHPYWVLLEYAEEQRATNDRINELNRALEEFAKIKSEWNLTTAEKRRIRTVARVDI